jgi:hypothetical protein
MNTKPIPEEIKDYIDYNSVSGLCVWKKSKGAAKAGQLIQGRQSDGYLAVFFNKSRYLLHRVVWFIHYGEDPGDREIDHMNGNRTDNRLSNLRLVSHQENQHNRSHLGVFRNPSGTWRANIQVDGKKVYLGYFDCPLLAGLAYLDAKKELHPTAVRYA